MKRKRISKFQKIDRILGRSINRAGIKNMVSASLVCFLADEVIKSLFKKDANKVKAASFKNNHLKFRVSDNFIASQVKLREQIIIQKINAQSEASKVLGIKFEISS